MACQHIVTRRGLVPTTGCLLLLAITAAAHAQRPKNPAFADPVVDPSLPNVLLIGDSISLGYHTAVREALTGKANVFRPKTNCGPTTLGLEHIDTWLGDKKWDIVHWNFGLHDLKYLGPNGENLADPQATTSHQQVPIEAYQANIKTLAERIKKAASLSVWRETTPVPKGAKGRVPGDSVKYNAAAARAIAEVGGVMTDPFFAFAASISDTQRPANVHYTPAGSQALGEHVADVIMKALQTQK
jgi:hypothetical protein